MEKSELARTGKKPKGLRQVQETHPLPNGRRELISAISHILEGGGVQALLVQIGKDIQVSRLVSAESDAGNEPPEPLQSEDMLDAARNKEMVAFVQAEGLSPFEYLFKAFRRLSKRGLIAIGVVINQNVALSDWFGFDGFDDEDLYGVPIYQNNQLPRDALLLVAAKLEDPQTVVFSLRLELNFRRENDANSGESVEERVGGQGDGGVHGEDGDAPPRVS